MTWHPPVPAEAVYRSEVAALGAGLRLLLYFYNCVERDGTFTFSLTQATGALEVEYETLRKWWQAIKKAGIVTVVKDMGHSGLRVQMRRDWIDWHVQNNNFSTSAQRENTTVEGKKKPAQPSLNGSSTVPQRENITVEHNVYGTQDSDQAGDQREREDRDGTARSLAQDHPAVALYQEAFPGIQLNRKQQAIIKNLVGEGVERLECWRATVQDYELSPNWKPENVGNMRNRFEHKLHERTGSAANGKHLRSGTGQHSERKPQVEADPDKW
jgi:hypothetical protein